MRARQRRSLLGGQPTASVSRRANPFQTRVRIQRLGIHRASQSQNQSKDFHMTS